ncbi:MAG: class I SAM-dependent methyltransferase [Candidatus Thorarchaeota archaeon]|jgi:ubiquinone/menaquinone biosynthesis C-methylase UbiE
METTHQGSHILDTGCGAGVPVAKTLVENGFRVTGIDISNSMFELARKHVPDAVFLLQNMTKLSFDGETFDGIISTFTLIHAPRTLHADVFRQFFRVLKSGGTLLISLGEDEWEETGEYHGMVMHWSHYDRETSPGLLKTAGFKIIWIGVLETRGEHHLRILSKKV